LRQNRNQPSKEQSRDNCEEGNGKPPHPLPSQETWQKNSQRNLWCWTVRPSGQKAPCQRQRLGMNTVQFPFGLFRRELHWVGKESGRCTEKVSERWKDGGDFVSDGYRVMFAGGPTCQRGVVVIAKAKVAERVTEIDRFGDRIIVVKVKANPVDMVIVQAYLLTTDYEDEEVEKLYDQLEEILGKQKGTDNVIVMGDFNAVVAEGKEDRVVGKFGLGKRNDRGERLIEFYKSHNLV